MVEFLIITGMSGAGRSTVADTFDDLGWFVIDNVPVPLFEKIVELTGGLGEPFERVAFVLGAGVRSGDGPGALAGAIAELRAIGGVRVVFVDAATDVLVQRYEETRRRHPQSADGSLLDAIEHERADLEAVKASADLVIDTSGLNLHELRARIEALFADGTEGGLQLRISSFGYKRGLPLDVDLVFDCRFLPNPHWQPELRALSGLDAPVRDDVLGRPVAEQFIDQLVPMLDTLIPAYLAEGKSFLGIAFGCTGGRHRSVAVAEEVAVKLRSLGYTVPVTHRDVDK